MANLLAMYIGNKSLRPKIQSMLKSFNDQSMLSLTGFLDSVEEEYAPSSIDEFRQRVDQQVAGEAYFNTAQRQNHHEIDEAFNEYYAVARTTRSFEETEQKLKAMFVFKRDELFAERKKLSSAKSLETALEKVRSGNMAEAREIIRKIDSELTGDMVELPLATQIMKEAVAQNNAAAKLGIDALDEAGLRYGNIVTLGGDAGSKKTRASLYLTYKYLLANPTKSAVYFEAEMPIEDIGTMLNQMVLRLQPNDRNVTEQIVEEKMSQISEEERNAFNRLHLAPSTSFMTADEIYDYVTYYNANWFVLDYLTMLGEDVQNNYDFVSGQMKTLKHLVHRTKSIGVILAQAKQNSVRAPGRVNKIPDPSDLEWSSKLNQYSAYQYMTFFPAYYMSEDYAKDWFYLINKKNRYGKLVDLHFRSSQEHKYFFEEVRDRSEYRESKEWLDGYKAKGRMQST